MFFDWQENVSVELKVEEIDDKSAIKGVIDILPLNFTAAIRNQPSPPLQVTGVHGLVNMTLSYRLKLSIANSTLGDGCQITPLTNGSMKSESAQSQVIEEVDATPVASMIVKVNNSINADSTVLPEKPTYTPHSKCLSRKDAIKLVVYSILMTSLILCSSVTLIYTIVQFCCAPRTPAERETILEQFLMEGMQYFCIYTTYVCSCGLMQLTYFLSSMLHVYVQLVNNYVLHFIHCRGTAGAAGEAWALGQGPSQDCARVNCTQLHFTCWFKLNTKGYFTKRLHGF